MYTCEYCKKSFKRENSLAVHMCERKRRFLNQREKHVVAGYDAYNFWYKLAMGSKKDKTYDDFAGSQYYSACVKFGRYIMDIRAVNPHSYIRWLTLNKTKLDTWCKDSVYNRYLTDSSKNETADRALERYVIHAEAWSKTSGHHWSDYFDKATPHSIVIHIGNGKISPWIIYSSDKAQKWLDTIPNDMLKQVADTLDPTFWVRKTKLFPQEVKFIREIIG